MCNDKLKTLMRGLLVIAAGLVLAAVTGGTAQAATYTWNCIDSYWHITTCWSPNGVPGSADTVNVFPVGIMKTLLKFDTATGNRNAGNIYINGGSVNIVTLQQSGGNLTAGNEYIGNLSAGAFTQSGGTNSVTNTLFLGYNSTGNGSYQLSGTGSLTANNETIGASGIGSFNQSGGMHNVTNFLRIGSSSMSNGSYDLSAGGLTAGIETIGESGIGSFTQSGGTHTVTNALMLGAGAGSTGTYDLNGGMLNAGSILNGAGRGTITINGGTLTVGGGNGSINVDTLVLGSELGTRGSHTLSGTGSLTAYNETIGASGTGSFTQSGGTNTVSNTLTLGSISSSSGTYHLNGGTLTVGNGIMGGAGAKTFNLAGGMLRAGNVNLGGNDFNFNSGTLSVDGFTGNLTNNGGTLAPGNSPGTTSVTGNYTQSATGTLLMELAGLTADTQYDVLNVSGIASLNGTLDIDLFGGFSPSAGSFFDLIRAESITGSFSQLLFPELSPGLVWDLSFLTDYSGTTDYVRLSALSAPSAVPVPPAVWLFGSGLLGLASIARRKRGVG